MEALGSLGAFGAFLHHRSCQRVLASCTGTASPSPVGANFVQHHRSHRSFTGRADLVALGIGQAFGAFQSSSSCVLSWRRVPGSFGCLFAAPAPICETVCRCVVSWHSVPGSFGRPFAVPAPICGVSWHWSCRRCRCAGQFRTCFRFCGIGFGDPPPICGISGPREGVPGSFGTLCAVPAPICGIVCCCAVNWCSVPGSFGLCFGVYDIS